jgi:molybdenum-dependent DNA-binding transcriptional regulator ModE
MTSVLSPERALARLAEMSRHVREAIVLDARGRRLAGAPALTEPARQLIAAAAAVEAAEVEVAMERGAVYAARSSRHAIAVVTARAALPALMLYDLRMLLAQLDDLDGGAR